MARFNSGSHPRGANGRFIRKGAGVVALSAGSALASRRAGSGLGRLAIEGGLPSVVPGSLVYSTVKAAAPLIGLTPANAAIGIGVLAVAGAAAYGVHRVNQRRIANRAATAGTRTGSTRSARPSTTAMRGRKVKR